MKQTDVGNQAVMWSLSESTNNYWLGVSPGLVVMGGDSYSKGRGFKSQHHIQD